MENKPISIDNIDLSNRARNALRQEKIETIEKMTALTEEELLNIPNLGRKTVDEILAKIKEIKDGEVGIDIRNPSSTEKKIDLSSPLYDIGLSRRSINALRREKIVTVEDMISLTEQDLHQIRNLGKKSVDEILGKINLYKYGNVLQGGKESDDNAIKTRVGASITDPEGFDEWLLAEDNQKVFLDYLYKQNYKTDSLEMLSTKAYNLLLFSGYESLHQFVLLSVDQLMRIHRMEYALAEEIHKHCLRFVTEIKPTFIKWLEEKQAAYADASSFTVFDLMNLPDYRTQLLEYVMANDVDVIDTNLSKRTKNRLVENGYTKASDFIFLTNNDLESISRMGAKSLQEIQEWKHAYLEKHESRILAIINGDESALWSDENLRERILDLYKDIGFKGLSLNEMTERLNLPELVTDKRLKKNIGILLSAGELEYVDYRCHRVYGGFEKYLDMCPQISDRNREFMKKRLNGHTLQEIADEYSLTRERVRQVIVKSLPKIKGWYCSYTGMQYFDEDYYRYLYETYQFDRTDGSQWLGIPEYVWRYLELNDIKQGDRRLEEASDDEMLDIGLRLKIRNYLHRNKVFVDGKWVEKRRTELEKVAVKKLCQENVSFTEFAQRFNEFLKQEGVQYDSSLYYTDEVYRTRKNRMMESRLLLWKLNEQIRFYDIDGRDYAELVDALNLNAYENIELSTAKLISNAPDVMKRYDIRDQYELHNLLRKIIPEGSYHDMHFGKMPVIRFGTFDRDAAIFDLLIENSPISPEDLADLIHDEYGYDQATTIGSYLPPFRGYYEHGVYTVDQKQMTAEHRLALEKELTDDFYYMDEIRRIYRRIVSEADVDEINPMNLKELGYNVLSRYAIREHLSLERYFKDILTLEEIMDIRPYRKRFAYVQMFSQVLTSMKRSLQIIEFEPNQIINISRLEKSGVTRDMIREYCDSVYDYVGDGEYFTIQSIKQDGFVSELDDLGFSDWFYANLLISDDRLSYGNVFSNLVFCKGRAIVTRKTCLEECVNQYGSIDRFDLISELENRFGCRLSDSDTSNLQYILSDSKLFYDDYLDRFYMNQELYYREIDETEGIQ